MLRAPILHINPLHLCSVLKCNVLLLCGDSLKPMISTEVYETSLNKITSISKFL